MSILILRNAYQFSQIWNDSFKGLLPASCFSVCIIDKVKPSPKLKHIAMPKLTPNMSIIDNEMASENSSSEQHQAAPTNPHRERLHPCECVGRIYIYICVATHTHTQRH